MQDVTIFLLFNKHAEEAVEFYIRSFSTVFGDRKGGSKVLATTYFSEEELAALTFLPEDLRPGPAGSVNSVRFQLNGREFTAVNGGNYFGKFHESMSIYVSCETQHEIDSLWELFGKDSQEIQPCGWIKDKYGVSWQIAPALLEKMTEDPDRQKTGKVMRALYGMKKIDLEGLKRAYEGH
jgi:predicted 3-demethylubiquinone-9 3-methyltransferase (glyoxalase superfamily)